MGRLGQFLHKIGRGIVHIVKSPFVGKILSKLGKVGKGITNGMNLLERGLNYYNPYHNLNEQAGAAKDNRRVPAINPIHEAIARDSRPSNIRNIVHFS
jgi:hypothetical protein